MEWYETQAGLIDEAEWKRRILEMCTDVQSASNPEVLVADSITEAIKKRIPRRQCGVLFSGGIDSTLIAFLLKRLGADFKCFSVGIDGSEDLKWASLAAGELGLELTSKKLSREEFESDFLEVKKILKIDNPVTLSIGTVTYSGMKLAISSGINSIFTGLGSEEIFAGYERHLRALKSGLDINRECVLGLLSMYSRDIIRDCSIAKALGCELRTPFLDENLIRISNSIPGNLKIDGNQKKIILRMAALRIGLPEKFALRKKRAAQYGSGFDKELKRAAKRHGFPFKKDYARNLL